MCISLYRVYSHFLVSFLTSYESDCSVDSLNSEKGKKTVKIMSCAGIIEMDLRNLANEVKKKGSNV